MVGDPAVGRTRTVTAEKIRGVMEEDPLLSATAKEIADELGVTRQAVDHRLRKFQNMGWVEKQMVGDNALWYLSSGRSARGLDRLFTGWTVHPYPTVSCRGCGSEMRSGDEGTFFFESTGTSWRWELLEVWCEDCQSDISTSGEGVPDIAQKFIEDRHRFKVRYAFVEAVLERQPEDKIGVDPNRDGLKLRSSRVTAFYRGDDRFASDKTCDEARSDQ